MPVVLELLAGAAKRERLEQVQHHPRATRSHDVEIAGGGDGGDDGAGAHTAERDREIETARVGQTRCRAGRGPTAPRGRGVGHGPHRVLRGVCHRVHREASARSTYERCASAIEHSSSTMSTGSSILDLPGIVTSRPARQRDSTTSMTASELSVCRRPPCRVDDLPDQRQPQTALSGRSSVHRFGGVPACRRLGEGVGIHTRAAVGHPDHQHRILFRHRHFHPRADLALRSSGVDRVVHQIADHRDEFEWSERRRRSQRGVLGDGQFDTLLRRLGHLASSSAASAVRVRPR